MQRALMFVAIAAAVTLIAASAVMNYSFSVTLGRTPFEGQVFGFIALAVDVLKAALVVFIAMAARDARRTFVIVGCCAFALFTLASLLAAAGFTAQSRKTTSDGRSNAAALLQRARSDLASLEAKLRAIPSHRAASIVEDALQAATADRRFAQAQDCTAASTSMLRSFCDEYRKIRSEMTAAREAARLETAIIAARAAVDRLVEAGAQQQADAQARLIGDAIGLSEEATQRLLIAFMALLVEVSSGFGMYLATGHVRREQQTAPIEDCESGAMTSDDGLAEARDTKASTARDLLVPSIEVATDLVEARRRNRLRSR